jgi:hypothetical protein
MENKRTGIHADFRKLSQDQLIEWTIQWHETDPLYHRGMFEIRRREGRGTMRIAQFSLLVEIYSLEVSILAVLGVV